MTAFLLALVVLWGLSTNAHAAVSQSTQQTKIVSTNSDATATSTPIPSTWGGIKAVYGMNDAASPVHKGGSGGLTINSWDPSGYQLSIQLEAYHALSTRNNGSSGVTLYVGNYAYAGGDWDYVNDPGGASALSAMKSHYSASQIGSYGLWREDWITRSSLNVGHGGYCKFFADLVQWRATGGKKGYLPCNTCAGGSVSNVGIGDIIQIPSNTSGHTAIVVNVLSRNNDGSVHSVDVIDSNYVGGDGEFIIAHHPISQPELDSYRTYH